MTFQLYIVDTVSYIDSYIIILKYKRNHRNNLVMYTTVLNMHSYVQCMYMHTQGNIHSYIITYVHKEHM